MPSTYGRAVIAAGQSLSNVVDLGADAVRVGLIMPSAWTTAALTVQAAAQTSSGGMSAFGDLYDDNGDEASISAVNMAPGRAISIMGELLAPNLVLWRYIRLRSGTRSSPVIQVAERVIEVVAKG